MGCTKRQTGTQLRNKHITHTQGKSRRLKERTIENVGALTLSMGSSTAGNISLDQLTHKVAEVYVRCGFDADKSISTLQVGAVFLYCLSCHA